MLTDVYLATTNPQTNLLQIYTNPKTWFSIFLHTALYAVFINLIKYALTRNIFSPNTNARITILLFLIMTVGYTARYLRVQDIYKAHAKNQEKTREHCDKAFITWFFLG